MSDRGNGVPSPYPYPEVPAFPKAVGPQPRGLPLHACMGLNSCRGSDRFGLDGPPGGSPNECAGQGYCSTTSDHSCHVLNDCRNQGGCGLYGTGEEMSRPADNDCRSLGSCATPINAERFSANGSNRGRSVWLRAREVFAEQWPGLRVELLASRDNGGMDRHQPLPETLGEAPDPFGATGPTALWISDGNRNPGAVYGCGSSGLSGA